MIYFQSISPKVDPESYLRERLQNFVRAFSEEEQDAVLRGFATPDAGGLPHFLPVSDLDGASEAVAAARKIIDEFFPLTPGEHVHDEELCALLTRRLDPEGALVFLRQTTSSACTFIHVPDRAVMGGRIIETSPMGQPPGTEEPAEESAAVPVWALALAKQLGQKLLEQLGSAVWDKVKKDVLGDTGLPAYYEQVYAELRSIVASAFEAHYVKEVKDFAAKFDHAMGVYNNFGREEQYFHIVLNTSFDLITKSNALGYPGAFHYAEASILHIMTLREGYKRLVEKGAKPEELQKAKDYISLQAKGFAANVTAKHDYLFNQRMATISMEPYKYHWFSSSPVPGRTIGGVREGVFDHDGTFLYSCAPIHHMFKDETNGFWNAMYLHALKGGYPSWKWVGDNLVRYRAQIDHDTRLSLKPLLEVAEQLKKFIEKPVG